MYERSFCYDGIMKYSLQRLGENDLVLMRDLNRLFGDVFEDRKTYSDKIPSDEYIISFLANKNHIVFVATIDNKVIGGLVAYTLTKFEMDRKEVYLYDLAILQ